MPIYKATFKVTTYYDVSIEAKNYEQAKDAANSIDHDDLEDDGFEDTWRGGTDLYYVSKNPLSLREGKIFDAQELLKRYEDN